MIKNIRVVQLWEILANGTQVPSQHFFEVLRDDSDNWEQLEIVNVLGRDHREKEGDADNIQGSA